MKRSLETLLERLDESLHKLVDSVSDRIPGKFYWNNVLSTQRFLCSIHMQILVAPSLFQHMNCYIYSLHSGGH